MSGANFELIKHTGSKLLQEGATFFKRLAAGGADPKFVAKLQALIDEYEGKAARMETQLETPAIRVVQNFNS